MRRQGRAPMVGAYFFFFFAAFFFTGSPPFALRARIERHAREASTSCQRENATCRGLGREGEHGMGVGGGDGEDCVARGVGGGGEEAELRGFLLVMYKE